MKTLLLGTDRVKDLGRMGRIMAVAVVGGAVCVSPVMAAPTVAFTETFTDGASGWNKEGAVSFVGAEALVSFAQQGGPGGPESATIWCSEGIGRNVSGGLSRDGRRGVGV